MLPLRYRPKGPPAIRPLRRLTASSQTVDHLVQQPISLGQKILGLQPAQRVFRDGHGQFRHPQRTPLNLAQAFETVGAHHHGADAPLLQFHRVVDTPRRAGPSIRQSDNHRLYRTNQFVDNFVRGR